MNFRSAATALAATLVVGLASAQTPLPTPATPTPAAAAAPATVATPPAPAPSVSKAWVLMDYATGQVLAGENIHEQLAPASITKVMTSYVIAAEVKNGKVRADDQVMMRNRASAPGAKVAPVPMAATAASRSTRPRAWKTWKKAWRSSPATTPRSPWPNTWLAARKPLLR